MLSDPATLGLGGLALLIAIQALQLVPKRNGEDKVVAAINVGNVKLCEAIKGISVIVESENAKTRERVWELTKLEMETHRSAMELHAWHAPDPTGKQTWKGVSGMEEALRDHFDDDAAWHAKHQEILTKLLQPRVPA